MEDRRPPELLIKIPATLAGLPAITAVIAEGSECHPLIFSVERHRGVMDAYLAGPEAVAEANHDLPGIHPSLRSSSPGGHREIDARLDQDRKR